MLSKHCINKVIVYAKFYFLVINENVRITDHASGFIRRNFIKNLLPKKRKENM